MSTHPRSEIGANKKLGRLDAMDDFFTRYHNRIALVLGLLALICLAMAFPHITVEDADRFLPRLR